MNFFFFFSSLLSLLICVIRIDALKFRGKNVDFSPTTGSKGGTRKLSSSSSINLRIVKSTKVPKKMLESVRTGVYLVRTEDLDDDDLNSTTHHADYLPEYKYDENLNATQPEDGSFGVVVRALEGFRTVCGEQKRYGKKRWWILNCPKPHKEWIKILAERDDVLWIAPLPRMKMFSYESRRLFLGATNADSTTEYTGDGSTVLISDTGVDSSHCSFYDPNHAVQLGSFASPHDHIKFVGIDNVQYQEYSNGPTLETDFKGIDGSHGTSTSGVAVGFQCMSQRTGVAPKSKLAFLDLGPAGTDEIRLPIDFYDVMQNARDSGGATVASMSWGSYTNGQYGDTSALMDDFSNDNPEFAIFASSGNEETSGEAEPANGKNVAGVGACFSRPEAYPSYSSSQRSSEPDWYTQHSMISFTSRGTTDGRVSPLLCAPGVSVLTPYGFATPSNDHNDFYLVSGTSFSSPAAAGLAAILQKRFADLNSGVTPKSALIRATMAAHGDPPTRVVYQSSSTTLAVKSTSPGNTFGTPIMDFDRMIDVNEGGVLTNTNRETSVCFVSSDVDGSDWNLVVSWTDVASVPGTSETLVNDLDFYVMRQDGSVVVSEDGVNNYEVTVVKNVKLGETIRLIVFVAEGESLVGTSQSFSVHVKGKGTWASCAGTCKSFDYVSCTSINFSGYKICDPITGDTSTVCRPKTCSQGKCGPNCADSCSSTEQCAVLTDGSGVKNSTGTCQVKSCSDEGYFVDSTTNTCKCAAGTSIPCPSKTNVYAKCDVSTGIFESCATATNDDSSIKSGSTVSSSSSASRFDLDVSIFFFFFFFLLCFSESGGGSTPGER